MKLTPRPIALAATLIACLAIFLNDRSVAGSKTEAPHNCRMWGITVSRIYPYLDTVIRTQLDSLKWLGITNSDGWGIGFFVSTGDTLLPLVARGEPCAPTDPRFDVAVRELTGYIKSTGIAHVRKGSTGPKNIPNPHPFIRKTLSRNLTLLFAHNGTLNPGLLIQLIDAEDPHYLSQNPPDYPAPDYLDSDLYLLYIIEIIDNYPLKTIEECISLAITRIDSAMTSTQCNFIMTDGYTLWALHYSTAASTSLHYAHTKKSERYDFWVVASVPLDTVNSWIEIPNATLAAFRPDELPVFISIAGPKIYPETTPTSAVFPIDQNPAVKQVEIRYQLNERSRASITVLDVNGAVVRQLVDQELFPGLYSILWDGRDNNGRDVPTGTYFCTFRDKKGVFSQKIILVK